MKTIKPLDAAKPASNLFITTILSVRKGLAASEASDKLAALVKECEKTGRAGTLTFTLKVTPNGDNASVSILDNCKNKMPEPSKNATILFTTEDGGLQKEHPKQPEFEEVVRVADREPESAGGEESAQEVNTARAVNG